MYKYGIKRHVPFMFVVFRAQIKVSMPAIAMLENDMNERVYSCISKFLCLPSQQILTFYSFII